MFSLDFETTSACDIGLGAYRYAADPTTRILVFAIAEDDGEPLLWSSDSASKESDRALDMLIEAINSKSLIYAHNAQFELAISTYRMWDDLGIFPPDIGQWRCTLAMCRRAAAPESLAKAAEFFGLSSPKDPRGKALIGIFSDQSKIATLTSPTGEKMQSISPILESPIPWNWSVQLKGAGTTMTVREAWDLFCEYCKQDVRVEQELHRKIKHFELKGDVLESFQFDLRMNWRGVPVNLGALRNADVIVESQKKKLGDRFRTITGLEHSQRAAVLSWLQERGYQGKDMTAATVDGILAKPEGMTPEAIKALYTRSLISFSALAKIPTMIESACPDGRVRGATQWHAARTGRAGGRIIQPQNFRKSTIGGEEHLCYRMLCEKWGEHWIEDMWESPLEAIASSIRHFIQPEKGGFFDADYAGVEARITPWLAGDQGKLDFILSGGDPYKRIAAMVFNIPYESVQKWQRTIAKPIELGCCFMVGARGLRTSLAGAPYFTKRTLAECKQYVGTYRENHPETVTAWKEIEEAAKSAIAKPGKFWDACNGKLRFQCGSVAGVPYLTMQLPSGRRLYYPHPTVKPTFRRYDEDEMLEEPWKREERGYWIDQITFYGKITGKEAWTRVPTWGGRLFENAVQSIGADLLNRGCIEAERRGYPICMIIHDQALCESASAQGGLAGFVEALCVKDDWAHDFPLEASGDENPYYMKEQ
jgi:DNA polymerase